MDPASNWTCPATAACAALLQGAESYLLPKPSEPQQWPVLVLDPMFWLLFAMQSMVCMGVCGMQGEQRLQNELHCCNTGTCD